MFKIRRMFNMGAMASILIMSFLSLWRSCANTKFGAVRQLRFVTASYIHVGYAGLGVTKHLTYLLSSATTNCIRLVSVKVVVDGSTNVSFNTIYHNGMK